MARALKLGATIVLAGSCVAADEERQNRDADWVAARAQMVQSQLRSRGISDSRVLNAMTRVERHRFIPAPLRTEAYGDHPVPIGDGQTISQPYIVAFMTQALAVEPHHRVLEIGTGSGYQAAILAELVKEVYTIEILPTLGERARATLQELGYRNVHVRIGNGYLGWPKEAPFDRVIVTAAPPEIPQPLVDQLKLGGRMAIPVGTDDQVLRIVERSGEGLKTLQTLPVRFVPMVEKK